MGILYQITSPSGKRYIGITGGTLRRRWMRHVSRAMSGQSRCPVIENAIRKYGADAFDVHTLVIADWETLVELEKKLIMGFGTLAPAGYNLSCGGDGIQGRMIRPETREKIRAAASARRLSEDQKRRIGDALRGRKRPEHSAKMKGRKKPWLSERMKQYWAEKKQSARQGA